MSESLAQPKVICPICPHACSLLPGQTGICGARHAVDGKVVETSHGLLSSIHVDPVEKKPLHHYYPGSGALSIGAFGCNLKCRGCQNASISQVRASDGDGFYIKPSEIVDIAISYQCRSVAYTYNEPIIWSEFAVETAHAVREAGLGNIMVTAGYVTDKTREWLFESMDAANVDLKGFSEEFYKTWAKASLGPVLETLEYLHQLPGFWLEITTLLIPGINDSNSMLESEFAWIVEHLGVDVPLHLSAFFPAYKATEIGSTPVETLFRAQSLAEKAGIRYVYLGNVPGMVNTKCPACGSVLIERHGYHTRICGMKDDKCASCGHAVAGVFVTSSPGRH